MPKLVFNPGSPDAREFQLQPGRNYVGRGFTNDFRVEDPSVSVSHLQLILNGNTVTVKDLGSTNGTFINRAPVKEGYLQPGQILQLGAIELLFAGDMPASTVAAGIAPTLALPLPSQRMQMPGAMKPPPMTPAGAFNPLPIPSAGQPAPVQSAQAGPSRLAPPLPEMSDSAEVFERRARRARSESTEEGLVVRCLGYGLAAMMVSGMLWLPFTIYIGQGLVPYLCWATGIVCGLALKSASGNRPGAMFSLMATGSCLIGVFIGEFCRVAANQSVVFGNDAILGIVAAVFSAWWIGGGLLVSADARRERLAG